MISKVMALKILDGIFVAATVLALLVIAEFPMDWLLTLADLVLEQVQWFLLVIIFAASCIIHAIAAS